MPGNLHLSSDATELLSCTARLRDVIDLTFREFRVRNFRIFNIFILYTIKVTKSRKSVEKLSTYLNKWNRVPGPDFEF